MIEARMQRAQILSEHAERAAGAAAKATYVGGGGTALFGLTLNEVGVVIGVLFTVATFAVTWYYRHRHYKLQQRLTEAEIEKIRDTQGVEHDDE